MSRECKRTSETRHEKHQWFDVHHVGDRGGDERVQRRRSGDNRIILATYGGRSYCAIRNTSVREETAWQTVSTSSSISSPPTRPNSRSPNCTRRSRLSYRG